MKPPPHTTQTMRPQEPPRFAGNLLLVEELSLRLALDILAAKLPGFGDAFVAEADKLLALPLPTPDTQRAMQTLRDHIAQIGEAPIQ